MTESPRKQAAAATVPYPSQNALRWAIGLRLIVISTLFLGILLIQVNSEKILPLRNFYGLILFSFGLSLLYLILYARNVPPRLQTWIQLLGDIAVVTGFVYFTGGLYSPFSFLYLTVIAVAAMLMRGGGLIFAGLSAVAYGLLIDLMVFEVLPVPEDLTGIQIAIPTSRILVQLLTNVVGFVLVAVLVSYLGESLRSVHYRLREEEERTRQFVALTDHVVRSVGAGIIATDLDGRVLHLNPAGARMLGITDGETVTGTTLDETMPLADQNWGLLKTRALDRKVMRLEGTMAASGARFGLTVGPLADEEENVVGFIVTFQDLSEIKVEAERLRMQERMAAVGELAARMAHEIKNPLASISGSAQVLARRKAWMTRASGCSTSWSTNRADFPASSTVFSPTPAPSRTTSAIATSRRCCATVSTCSVAPTNTGRITTSTWMFRTVFPSRARNTCCDRSSGICRATRSRPCPKAAGSRSPASRLMESSSCRWHDSGVGMTEDVRRQAFEPFVTTRPGGTGLGLAVVYAAVAEHGGTIAIDSAPGRGTVVTVELPVNREAG